MRSTATELRMTPAALGAIASGDLRNALIAATPGGIEAQEKAGQASLTRTFNQLPKDGVTRYQAALERFGFKIGESVDELFVRVTPPGGWTLRASEHDMWSYIHDEQGRKRGGVFYKAAFYDRRAYVRLDTRYVGGGDYRDDGKRYAAAKDTATGTVLMERGPSDSYEQGDKDDAATYAYLDEHFPDWKSVEAYW